MFDRSGFDLLQWLWTRTHWMSCANPLKTLAPLIMVQPAGQSVCFCCTRGKKIKRHHSASSPQVLIQVLSDISVSITKRLSGHLAGAGCLVLKRSNTTCNKYSPGETRRHQCRVLPGLISKSSNT